MERRVPKQGGGLTGKASSPKKMMEGHGKDKPTAAPNYSGPAKQIYTGKIMVVLSYRTHQTNVHQRRYYAGDLQIGFAREENRGWRAFLIATGEHSGLYGKYFETEALMHEFMLEAMG